MSVYLINIHLGHVHDENCGHHHHHDSNLERKIQSLGAWAHILPTAFVIETELNAEEITNSLNEVKDSNDLFFVTKITEDFNGAMHPKALEWIKNRI